MSAGLRLLTGALALTGLCLAANAHSESSGSQNHPAPSGLARLKQTAKHDSALAGAAIKDGAHRVALAAKAVAHEIAMASKRGAAETRAAFKGERT